MGTAYWSRSGVQIHGHHQAAVGRSLFPMLMHRKKGSCRAGGCAEAPLGNHEGKVPRIETTCAPPANAIFSRAISS
eukprot:7198229-Pyramimonas_sp.AAC.1